MPRTINARQCLKSVVIWSHAGRLLYQSTFRDHKLMVQQQQQYLADGQHKCPLLVELYFDTDPKIEPSNEPASLEGQPAIS